MKLAIGFTLKVVASSQLLVYIELWALPNIQCTRGLCLRLW